MSLVTAFFDPEMRTSPRRGPTGSIPHVTWPGELAGGWCSSTGSGTEAIMAPVGVLSSTGDGSRPAGRGWVDTTCRRRVVRVRAR